MKINFFIILALIVIKISPAWSFGNIDKKELSDARSLIQILKDLKKNKINTTRAKKLYKKIDRKNNIFQHYADWLQSLVYIANIKDLNHFTPCKTIINNNRQNLLDQKTIRYCYSKFIKLYGSANKISQKKHHNTFKSYLPYYLFPLKKPFLKFLKEISKRQLLQFKVSEEIFNIYSRSLQSIDVEILPYLTITTEMTRYIQKTGLHDKNFKLFHQERMSKLIRQMRSKLYLKGTAPHIIQKKLKELIKISRQNSDIIDHNFARSLFIGAGRRFLRKNMYSQAKICFDEALSYSNSNQYYDTLFLYLWPDLLAEKYHEVNETISDLDLHGKFQSLNIRLKFWIAYTSEKIGKINLSQYYYNNVIDDEPISYYSVLSTKRLNFLAQKNKNHISDRNLLSPAPSQKPIPAQEYSNLLITQFMRLKAFSKLQHNDLIAYENNLINKTPINLLINNYQIYSSQDEDSMRGEITLHMITILNQNKNYLNSFSLIFKRFRSGELNMSLEVLKKLFPTPYISEIKKIINYEIDPYIILSLIRQESAFDPRAKSRVGARGLMQLMPTTARQMMKRLSKKSLSKPKLNLKLGIKHFTKLYDRYDKNLIYSLAAYNAGSNKVQQWKKNYFKDHSTLHIVESIPYKETRLYVKLIYRNLFFYKLINGYKNDPQTINKIFDVLIAKK